MSKLTFYLLLATCNLLLLTFYFLLISSPARALDLTVNPDSIQRSIPENFLGLSAGQKQICNEILLAKKSQVYQQLLKNLSPAVFRFGGTGQKRVFWKPNESWCSKENLADGNTNLYIGKKIVDDTFSVFKKAGWQLIWPLNIQADPKDMLKVADYVLTKGDTLLTFTPNNEHDKFSALTERWTRLVTPLKETYPQAPISGPGNSVLASAFTNTLDRFVENHHSDLDLATFHYYSLRSGHTEEEAIQALLDNKLFTNKDRYYAKIPLLLEKLRPHNIPLRMDEGNSHAGGGKGGVSNAYVSALWGTDFAFSMLELGLAGINFNGNASRNDRISYYSPISKVPGSTDPNQVHAQPLYYSMLLFKYAASDGYLVESKLGKTNKNINAFAVKRADNSLRVILINKDSGTTTVNINTTQDYASANRIRLTGPSLTTTITSPTDSQIKLGGRAVQASGKWKPNKPTKVNLEGNLSSISLPGYTATVVSYYPQAEPPPELEEDLPGDLNGDGRVDIFDYQELIANFGNPYTIFDYQKMIANFGASLIEVPDLTVEAGPLELQNYGDEDELDSQEIE
jgi:hypothetical protein